MQLVVENLAKAFGVHEIFKDVSFMVDKGEKIGLVGANGSGKTTLLKCLLHPDYADGGMVKFDSSINVGYVEQGFEGIGEESIWDFMMAADKELIRLRRSMAELEQKVADGSEENLKKYASVMQRYEHIEGYNYEAKIKMVLMGLDFPESNWNMRADRLSGGQKTRLMLAGALVSSPEFLILDEPTNHLDIKMMEWLEGYLRAFKGGLLIVSHDRAFLDNVATRILEMEGGALQSFNGNYSRYLEQKEIQMKTEQAAYDAQQEHIAREEAYIRRFKAGIKSKMARGRQSRLDRLERLDRPVEQETFTLKLPPADESAERVVIMDELTAGYGDNRLVRDISVVLNKGRKVGLIGANGSGKTTLLKTILGEIPPVSGKVKLGNRVQVGYFSQSYERLNPDQTLFDNFLDEYGFTNEQTRSVLGGMLFHGDEVFKEIGTLSGGQKARLVLLKLVLDGANLLVLDEPTNHLDIPAQEAVEAALEVFDGTVLIVSHDRYFLSEIVDRVWEIEDCTLKEYKGDFAYYEKEKARIAEQEREDVAVVHETADLKGENASKNNSDKKKDALSDNSNGNSNGNSKDKSKKRKRRHSPDELQNLLDKVELSLREQEAMLKMLDREISIPENQMDPKKSAAMAKEREAYEEKIDSLMLEWEELLEEQEEMEA